MSLLRKRLNSYYQQRQDQRRADVYRSLIRYEAKIGGQLFGPVSPGGRREFFCLDEHTWIWHEEWLDQTGQRQIRTTRYDVRPSGIVKAQDGRIYQELSLEEARHLYRAMHLYADRVKAAFAAMPS